MALLLLALSLPQDEVDDIIARFSADSLGAKERAVRELVSRGRPAVPVLHKVAAKASGEPQSLARRAILEIGKAEVAQFLGAEPRAVRTVADDEFAKLLPKLSVYVQLTEEGEDGKGSARRAVAVNDLSDEKGAPVRIAKPEDVVKLMPAGKDEAGVRTVARAALFVLRATQPKAHTDPIVGQSNGGGDRDNWFEPEKYEVRKGADGWTVSGIFMQFSHEWMALTLAFDAGGRLAKIGVASTGEA